MGLVGNRKTVRLKYFEEHAIDAGGLNAVSTVMYRANGMFDPSVSTGGTQPLGFDEYMKHYKHFTVRSARIKVTFLSTNSDINSQYSCFLSRKNDESPLSNKKQLAEQPSTKHGVMHAFGSGGDHVILTDTINISQFFSQDIMAGRIFAGQSAADPTEQVYWHVAVAGIGQNDPSVCRALVEIVYTATFHEPKAAETS